MAIQKQKIVSYFFIVVALAFSFVVIGTNMSGCDSFRNESDVENPASGGITSHQTFNAGTVLSVDESSQTFKMTIEGYNRDHLFGEELEVYYGGHAVFYGECNELVEGAIIQVGYVQPVFDYPIQAESIYIPYDHPDAPPVT